LRTSSSLHTAVGDGVNSELRYKALIQASASVVWRARPDGQIIEAWGWDKLSDQPKLEYLGSGWLEAVHPDDRDRVIDYWTGAIAAGEIDPLEYRVRQPDGSYRWAMARAIALRNSEGAICEWVGTVTDIQERKDSEQALREREELLSLALDATGLGVWEMELPSHKTSWSPRLKAMVGLGPDDVIDDELFYRLVHPDDRYAVEQQVIDAVETRNDTPYSFAYRIFRVDTGEERWWHEWSRLVNDASGAPARLVGAIQDITERQKAEIERRNSEKRWRLALKAGRMMAWERHVDDEFTTRSDNAQELLGLGSGPASDFVDRVHPVDRQRLLSTQDPTSPEASATTEFRYRHPNGREMWLESSAMRITGDGERTRLVGVTSDITERKAAEEKLRYAASYDALTGLLNRAALQTALDQAIGSARTDGRAVTLILVDIDHFKDINDTLGHDAGDILLRTVGRRLRSVVGETGMVARLGGDEFAVLSEGLGSDHEAERLASALLQELRKGFTYLDKVRTITASLGFASFPDHASQPSDMLKNADLALYAAKTGGRARVRKFAPEMRQAVEQRTALLADVQQGLARGEFVPFYQPKVDLASGKVVGFEALARWLHPTRGVLTPQIFGPAFADGELTIAIGEAMLARMIEDMAAWLSRGFAFGRVALNLSSFEFMTPDLADRLLAQLGKAGIPSSCFEIEVTETVLLDGKSRGVATTLQRLHRHGVKISLDDFGTGYASLTHLKRFPVDELKIDRSFVRNLEVDADDAAIVSAVIGLARNMGLTVVSEGVETPGQAARLLSMGCHLGQGYHFAKPMAGSRVPWFLTHAHKKLAQPTPTWVKRGPVKA